MIRKITMPSTPPTRPPTAPSTVLWGLTSGDSLCLPQAIPVNRAAESLQKAATSGTNTSPPP